MKIPCKYCDGSIIREVNNDSVKFWCGRCDAENYYTAVEIRNIKIEQILKDEKYEQD